MRITKTRHCFGHFPFLGHSVIVSSFGFRTSNFPVTALRGRRLQRRRRQCRCFVPRAARCKARRQRRGYAGLQWVCRRQTRSGQFRGLRRVILPVVVAQARSAPLLSRSSSVGLASAFGTPKAVRLGPIPRSDNPVIAAVVAQDEARDHDVVARADKGPRADIGQLRQNGLTQVVDFNQADTRRCYSCPAPPRYRLPDSRSHQSLIRDYWSARDQWPGSPPPAPGRLCQLSLVIVANPPGRAARAPDQPAHREDLLWKVQWPEEAHVWERCP